MKAPRDFLEKCVDGHPLLKFGLTRQNRTRMEQEKRTVPRFSYFYYFFGNFVLERSGGFPLGHNKWSFSGELLAFYAIIRCRAIVRGALHAGTLIFSRFLYIWFIEVVLTFDNDAGLNQLRRDLEDW